MRAEVRALRGTIATRRIANVNLWMAVPISDIDAN